MEFCGEYTCTTKTNFQIDEAIVFNVDLITARFLENFCPVSLEEVEKPGEFCGNLILIVLTIKECLGARSWENKLTTWNFVNTNQDEA